MNKNLIHEMYQAYPAFKKLYRSSVLWAGRFTDRREGLGYQHR
jgi:hypothetical protein